MQRPRCGQGWIRTSVPLSGTDLQSVAFNHSATYPHETALPYGPRTHGPCEADDRARTDDPHFTKVPLYPLSYVGVARR